MLLVLEEVNIGVQYILEFQGIGEVLVGGICISPLVSVYFSPQFQRLIFVLLNFFEEVTFLTLNIFENSVVLHLMVGMHLLDELNQFSIFSFQAT